MIITFPKFVIIITRSSERVFVSLHTPFSFHNNEGSENFRDKSSSGGRRMKNIIPDPLELLYL